MAYIKRRTLFLSGGKQIKMAGISICITPTMEIGEGFTNNIFGLTDVTDNGKVSQAISNPNGLTDQDLHEIADFIITTCMEFKAGIRAIGIKDPNLFKRNPGIG